MASERELSSVLRDFARNMVTDFPRQAILDHLVERIVEILPVSAAGVTLISENAAPRYVAASDDSALRYERLQIDLGEGPCLAAYQSGEPVGIADLRGDHRFPRFRSQALDAGLAAVFTFPLHNGDGRLGALDLYRDTPGALGPEDMVAAETLADVTAAYLVNAQARQALSEASARSLQLSLHDGLTGLANRTLLLELAGKALRGAQRTKAVTALLFVDLDRFKAVNDQHGHRMGDDVLTEAAHRISSLVRPGDTVARLSGDEFAVLCEDLDDPDQAGLIAERVVAGFEAPLELSGHRLELSVSIGVAFAGPDDRDPKGLLERADLAMYDVKRAGGAGHRLDSNW